MKLVSYAHLWHKLWSLRFLILTGALGLLQAAYSGMPDVWQAHLPEWVPMVISTLTWISGVLAGASTLVDQVKLRIDDTDVAGA